MKKSLIVVAIASVALLQLNDSFAAALGADFLAAEADLRTFAAVNVQRATRDKKSETYRIAMKGNILFVVGVIGPDSDGKFFTQVKKVSNNSEKWKIQVKNIKLGKSRDRDRVLADDYLARAKLFYRMRKKEEL